MRFTISPVILSLSSLAFAQNAFNVPMGGYGTVQAGSTVNLSWAPTTGGTVTLVLRFGSGLNLAPGSVIEANVPNSGSYSWQVPANIAAGSSYTVQIVDDQNPNIVNYTPSITINSDVSSADASSVTGQVTFATTPSATGASSAMSTDASSDASSAASSMITSDASSMPTSAASSTQASTGASSSTSSRATSTTPQSTIDNHTGAAFRALPTAFAGAVGAVMGAAAFIL